MAFRDELKKVIPERLHAQPDFKALVDMAVLNNLNNKDELYSYFNSQIGTIEEWLRKNQSIGGTAIRIIRDKIVKLDCLKNCKRMCDEFL